MLSLCFLFEEIVRKNVYLFEIHKASDNGNLDKISFASPGDSIKFYPIDIKEHNYILNNLNTYKIESEVSND